MTPNEILLHICHTFDLNDSEIADVFGKADHPVTSTQISGWLKNDDNPGYQELSDTQLAVFLNGLIIHKRGRKEGPHPQPETVLTNNIIFKKLRIALDLKADEIMEILALADLRISKHELSAFFRKPDHKHYRNCKDPILLKFLKGVLLKYHADK